MLAYPAQLYRLDVLHGKYNVFLGHQVIQAFAVGQQPTKT
jgi:hypothetical protein